MNTPKSAREKQLVPTHMLNATLRLAHTDSALRKSVALKPVRIFPALGILAERWETD